jgi:hypothetical protein
MKWLMESMTKRMDQLESMEKLLDCRAGKLLKKGKYFLVVAHDEPYFLQVYDMIREHEIAKGRWSEEDQQIYEEWNGKTN